VKVMFPVVMIMLVLLVIVSILSSYISFNIGNSHGLASATPIMLQSTPVVNTVHDIKIVTDQQAINSAYNKGLTEGMNKVPASNGNYQQGFTDGQNDVRNRIWNAAIQCNQNNNGYTVSVNKDNSGYLHFTCA
jgi:hypothetical protein